MANTVNKDDLRDRMIEEFTKYFKDQTNNDPTSAQEDVIREQADMFAIAFSTFLNSDVQVQITQNPVTKDVTGAALVEN